MARLNVSESETQAKAAQKFGKADLGVSQAEDGAFKSEATTKPRKQRLLKPATGNMVLFQPLGLESLRFATEIGLEERKRCKITSTSRVARQRRTVAPAASPIHPKSQNGYANSEKDSDQEQLNSPDSEGSIYVDARASPEDAYHSADKQPRKYGAKSPIEIVDLTSPEKKPKPVSKAVKLPLGTISGNERTSPSSTNDPFATIRFSPPRSSAPAKIAQPILPRSRTPSPPPSPSKGKLASPKKASRLPTAPHRPSIDAFWNPEVVSAWTDEYSPQKVLKSPRKLVLQQIESEDEEEASTPTHSPSKSKHSKSSPTKNVDRAKADARKAFDKQKHGIADRFLDELEETIGKGEVRKLAASTGGVKVVWSKKLATTGGRAHWKREDCKSVGADGVVVVTSKHYASIELAEKVVDDEHRLLNVLAHEYCHLLNFMISRIKNQPHGASFQRWAALVSNAFAARNVIVTTKHDYQIAYRFAWACVDDACAAEYQRHSRSIDPARQACGKCKGKLVQVRPAPKKKGAETTMSRYQVFVKERFAEVKRELEREMGGKSPMKDVMREIGVRYRSEQAASGKGKMEASVGEFTSESVDLEDEGESEEEGDELASVARKLDFLSLAPEI